MSDPRADDPIRANNALWDEWTAIHERSEFYDLEGFKRGGVRLRPYEIEEIGAGRGQGAAPPPVPLRDRHAVVGPPRGSGHRRRLQPGGLRSGVARSPPRSASRTRGSSDRTSYDLPASLEGDFDVVYTSRGVLGWLPDIRRWAEVVAHFVRPGGIFYITEIHPVAQAFEDEGVEPGELRLVYPYWEHREPLAFTSPGLVRRPDAPVTTPKEYGWDHGLGEIVTALIDAGLRIESLREYPFVEWKLRLPRRGRRQGLAPAAVGQGRAAAVLLDPGFETSAEPASSSRGGRLCPRR